MEGGPGDSRNAGAPELTELGKRIEMLRIQRGISKQHLARVAGTSRQQLWRVMTGKSEMSLALRARIADVLQSPTIQLNAQSNAPAPALAAAPSTSPSGEGRRATPRTTPSTTPSTSPIAMPGATYAGARIPIRIDFERYLDDADAIARTLSTMPTGTRGRALKRRFLDAVEDAALEARSTLGAAFFDLRRRVLAGEL
jgi:transcriptional regulator with XRE-family HTH domain